jgi:hypothetical protein
MSLVLSVVKVYKFHVQNSWIMGSLLLVASKHIRPQIKLPPHAVVREWSIIMLLLHPVTCTEQY